MLDDSNRVGLSAARHSERRGGVYGTIRTGGPVQVGGEYTAISS